MKKYRREVLQKIENGERFECPYCKEELTKDNYNIDHIIPRKRGGDNSDKNLQTICKTCNSRKGTKTHEEFKEYLKPHTEGVVPLEELTEYNLYVRLHNKFKEYGKNNK